MKGIDEMARAGGDLRPVWREAQPLIRDDLYDHFEKAIGPGGTWQKRAPSSEARILQGAGTRRKRGARKGLPTARGAKRLRNQLGRLKTAWLVTIRGGFIEFRNRVWWSDIHYEGGVAGKGSRIPARPFAFVSQRVLDTVATKVVDFIRSKW